MDWCIGSVILFFFGLVGNFLLLQCSVVQFVLNFFFYQ
jgi:hypothetical protein